MNTDISISVKNLNHFFGKGTLKKQILFDINTDICAGEIVIVTGPSGSGKTTLLTIVSALRSIEQGDVTVLGHQLNNASKTKLASIRKNIGFIFQQHNLLGALTALQNVKLGLEVCGRFSAGQIQEKAHKYLEAVGLSERKHYYPSQLSGGQRQRVAIARAMASEPKILMADEPTASLDKKSGRDVVDRMRSMAKQNGTTILLVTHDNRILDIADRIIYLEDGKVASFNAAVIDNSQHMMKVVSETPSQQPTAVTSDYIDFHFKMTDLTLQSQKVLALKSQINAMAYFGIVKNLLQDFNAEITHYLTHSKIVFYTIRNGDPLSYDFTDNSEQTTNEFDLSTDMINKIIDAKEFILVNNATEKPDINHKKTVLSSNTKACMYGPIIENSSKIGLVAVCFRSLEHGNYNKGQLEQFRVFCKSVHRLAAEFMSQQNEGTFS